MKNTLMTLILTACVAGCLLAFSAKPAAAQQTATAKEDRYTASAERRAALLKQVRDADKARAAAKAKAQTVTIVNNGEPAATIVVAPPPPPEPVAEPVEGAKPKKPATPVSPGMSAAKVLQDWVKLMSGATLPISETPGPGVNIYVGTAASIAGLDMSGINPKSETPEGIRIKADGKNVYIGSQTDGTAAIRAVGRFLEIEFGCRFFANPQWGMVYPSEKTLKVMTQDITEAPTITFRTIWGANGAFRHPYWANWNGSGGIGIPTNHSWHFLPKDEFEKNPDYFRMDDKGVRVNGPWYNLGNPEVRKLFIEWALKASENGTKNISMSPPDDHRFDYSPEAKKYDNPNVIDPSSGLISMTDRFMGLVNEAALKIKATGGNARIGFYAYSDYTLPPTNPALDTLATNIMVNIAPIRFSRYHPIGHPNSSSAMALSDIIDGWGKRASMMGYRTYNYNLAEVMTPFSKISVWAHDLPYLQKRKFISYNFESFDCWELSAPHLYLSIRLAYDPTQDPWLIMADFYDKFYGPAAEPMEKYWMTLDVTWANLKTEAGSIHALPDVYTVERMKELDGYLKQAEQAAAGKPEFEARVLLARRGFKRAQFWRAWYEANIAGDPELAKKIYDEWTLAVEETFKARNGNDYEKAYLRRFIGGNVGTALASVQPKDAPARKVIGVLPDDWKYMTEVALQEKGVKGDYFAANFDDSKWPTVKTYTSTLNAQGYPEYLGVMWYRTTYKAPKEATGPLWLHFTKADRKITLFINGKQVSTDEIEGFRGATIDIAGFLKPGVDNQITVRINHIPLPELFLGGIVGPIHLIAPK